MNMIAAPATIPVRPIHRGIRQATLEDVPQILEMGHRFIQDVYRHILPVNVPQMTAFVVRLLEGENSTVFVAESDGAIVGMIGMFAFEHPMSGEHTASEAFWWVNPGARGSIGIRLLRRAQRWAQERGAAVFQMIAPNEMVGQIYERLGFDRVEVSWQQRLPAVR